ncbi:Endonuclease/Exonuclease/phosphatase family protein [compost metagenome]
MSTISMTPYQISPPVAAPAVTVTPLGPLALIVTAPAFPTATGWGDAYVTTVPMVGLAPASSAPVTASIPAMLESLRNFLSSVGSHLSALLGAPPAPTAPPSGPKDPSNPSPKNKSATSFVVSSFNVLGSNHTRPGGTQPSYAPGTQRIREAIPLLLERKVDVVGFQELQVDQVKEFKQHAGDTYGLYPGGSMGPRGSQNSIAWRKDKFKVVESYTVKMPSHRGMLRETPVMRLRDKQTGEEFYVVNIHNAPGFHKGGAQQHWRDKATDLQVELLNRLKRSGIPVILTGDMNEKENYFQRMTREVDMNAANELPSGKLPKRVGIDWIFGTQDVTFKGYKRVGETVSEKISDHAMIVSKVKL